MQDPITVEVFRELIVVAGVSVLTSLILSRFKFPIITILLIAGVLIGPHGFSLVDEKAHIQLYAEFGVVLLLVSIGLQYSLKRLIKIWGLISIGGTLQVGLTTAVVTGLALYFDQSMEKSLFYGIAFALSSSTAVVLRTLTDRQEIDAPHGRIIIGTLIFQDLCIVPMFLILPILAGDGGGNPLFDISFAMMKAAIIIVLILVISRWAVPKLFEKVDRLRSSELFLFTVITLCIGTAWFTSYIGLSLSLGAFLAGMILADTEHSHRATANVHTLRDIFTSFFFISVGMMFDFRFAMQNLLIIGLLFVVLLFGKALIASFGYALMRFPLQIATIAGLGVAQFGETGFIMMKAGEQLGIIDSNEAALLLNAGILTLIVTPMVISLSPKFTAGALKLRRLESILGVRGIDNPSPVHSKYRDHVVIVGFGIGGQALARALKRVGVQYLVIELDVTRVREARQLGEPVYYGDIATPEALENAHVKSARGLVLMINDHKAAERAIAYARKNAPNTPVFVRTKYLNDSDSLLMLGATDVVVEEVEAGLAMLAKVLKLTEFERSERFELLKKARIDVKNHQIGSER
ncbi:MAG: cation:proton antiporter [bacterium]|nr:cation:proton antiporter [bacterium]